MKGLAKRVVDLEASGSFDLFEPAVCIFVHSGENEHAARSRYEASNGGLAGKLAIHVIGVAAASGVACPA